MSKKAIIPFFLIGFSAIAGYFLFSQSKPTQIYNKQTASLLVQKEAIENPNLDSDNDGLKDWEEALWKTDPLNPDTDGDKTPDGEEIAQNRNPLVKGPNDSMLETMFQGDSEGKNSDSQTSDTFTETIGQGFFANYLITKQANGGQINAKDANDIANSALSAMDQYVRPTEDVYKNTDLQTIPATAENMKSYGNEFGALIKKYFDPIPNPPLTVLLEAMEAENSSGLEELKPISLAYKNTAEELLKIKVPESLATSHSAIANNFLKISKQIDNMARVFNDPALASIAFKQYLGTSDSTRAALKAIQSSFLANRVVFQNNEPGKYFAVFTNTYQFSDILKAYGADDTKNLF